MRSSPAQSPHHFPPARLAGGPSRAGPAGAAYGPRALAQQKRPLPRYGAAASPGARRQQARRRSSPGGNGVPAGSSSSASRPSTRHLAAAVGGEREPSYWPHTSSPVERIRGREAQSGVAGSETAAAAALPMTSIGAAVPAAVGVAAALGGPLAYSGAFFLWEKWTGSSTMLNLLKCSLASAVFVAVGLAATVSQGWFAGATATTVYMLLLSGFLGIVIGDTASLQSLQMIGARRYIVIDSTKPFFAGVLGWALLGEPITPGLVIGMVITMTGVLMVSLEKTSPDPGPQEETAPGPDGQRLLGSPPGSRDPEPPAERRGPLVGSLLMGGLLAVVHTVLDVLGSIITKQYGSAFTVMEVNTIRFGSSSLILGLSVLVARALAAVRGPTPPGQQQQQQTTGVPSWARVPKMSKSSWLCVLAGSMLGTFCAPTLMNFALFRISFPVYATLVSVGPIFSVPLAWLINRQPVTWRAAAGSLLAFVGVIPLYLYA